MLGCLALSCKLVHHKGSIVVIRKVVHSAQAGPEKVESSKLNLTSLFVAEEATVAYAHSTEWTANLYEDGSNAKARNVSFIIG